jgi:hypothetical protein
MLQTPWMVPLRMRALVREKAEEKNKLCLGTLRHARRKKGLMQRPSFVA